MLFVRLLYNFGDVHEDSRVLLSISNIFSNHHLDDPLPILFLTPINKAGPYLEYLELNSPFLASLALPHL